MEDDLGAPRPALARLALLLATVPVVALAACRPSSGPSGTAPRLRTFTVTAVPLLVKEQQAQLPFLVKDFAPGGVLEGKEVYAFEPSTLVAERGDTLVLSLVNPEDDEHTFVLEGRKAVEMPGQSTVVDTVVASRSGIFRFECDIPAHSPYMYGQLVVLNR